jgi:hypothetical protein
MTQKAVAPPVLRNVPEIFCWTLSILKSLSARLLVNGIDRLSKKASTSSARFRRALLVNALLKPLQKLDAIALG